jgi:hypothetical protein
MGAGQVQVFAQEMDEEGSVLDVDGYRFAVHRQLDCRHASFLRMLLIIPIRNSGEELGN